MNKLIELTEQLLEVALQQDAQHKALNRNGKASETIGESFMVHHLKILKKELQKAENDNNSENNRPK